MILVTAGSHEDDDTMSETGFSVASDKQDPEWVGSDLSQDTDGYSGSDSDACQSDNDALTTHPNRQQ